MDLKNLQDIPPWEWPRGIGNEFLMVLRNPQAAAADRLLAAQFAGDLVVLDNFLAHTLLAIVSNAAEPEKLRAKAAVSLGPVLEQAELDEFDDPDAVPVSETTFRKIAQTLRNVYLDATVPKLVRRRILEAAVRSPEAWHAEAILTAYASDDPEWKLTAVFCMRYIRGFDTQILEAWRARTPGFTTRQSAPPESPSWMRPGRTLPRSSRRRIPARTCCSPPFRPCPAFARAKRRSCWRTWPIPATRILPKRPPRR